MQVSIDFHPMQNGESQEELVVSYDTGLFLLKPISSSVEITMDHNMKS